MTDAPKARGRPRVGAIAVNVRVPPDLVESIDRFISMDAPGSSRAEALRRLAAEHLKTLGVRPAPDTR
ncbi:hypothetical protein [Brevundimonas faecalis]|uniref:Ribbon-helix-helix protein, CopG family n=1 Tax=Brevundimonas faecalis TaxID=947378 RepID=A0ABV2R8P2_9CAUL